MKRFPYTESTEMIVYVEKPKKKKNVMFRACVCSALISSILTAGIIGLGSFIHFKAGKATSDGTMVMSGTDVSYLSNTENNNKELTIPEIAKLVGPSCVGVVNKTKILLPLPRGEEPLVR